MIQRDSTKVFPRICVAVVLERGEKVLLLKRRDDLGRWPGVWCLPGGMLEFGETLIQCCRREVEEETGVRCWTLMPVVSPTEFWSESEHLVGLVYRATIWEREPENREPEKHDQVAWFGWEDLPASLMPGTRQFVDHERVSRSVTP